MTLRSIARLSRQDVGVLMEAVALRLPVEIGLRVTRFDVLLRRWSGGRRAEPSAIRATPARAAALVQRVTAIPVLRATCLKQSLILLRILRRRGYPAELRIGVQGGERFGSHAWVECEGQTLLDDGGGRFTTIPF